MRRSWSSRPYRDLTEHTNQPREAPAESRPVAAKKFYLVAELVDLDPEAVELDLVLPVVTGRHGLGEDRATGLDELQEHAQFFNGASSLTPPGYSAGNPFCASGLTPPEVVFVTYGFR
jgi:hypothetical protein